MKTNGNERKSAENNALLKTWAYLFASRVLGFERSQPNHLAASNNAEAVNVNTNPIRNWMKIRLCLPKIMLEITVDKTNIHAKEQMKTARPMFELKVEAKYGIASLRDDATVVNAVLVKIW